MQRGDRAFSLPIRSCSLLGEFFIKKLIVSAMISIEDLISGTLTLSEKIS